jgi:hypothetical protein
VEASCEALLAPSPVASPPRSMDNLENHGSYLSCTVEHVVQYHLDYLMKMDSIDYLEELLKGIDQHKFDRENQSCSAI